MIKVFVSFENLRNGATGEAYGKIMIDDVNKNGLSVELDKLLVDIKKHAIVGMTDKFINGGKK